MSRNRASPQTLGLRGALSSQHDLFWVTSHGKWFKKTEGQMAFHRGFRVQWLRFKGARRLNWCSSSNGLRPLGTKANIYYNMFAPHEVDWALQGNCRIAQMKIGDAAIHLNLRRSTANVEKIDTNWHPACVPSLSFKHRQASRDAQFARPSPRRCP